MWKMKPPEKKALVKREDPNELRSKVRKGARKKNMEPVKALSEFQEIDSFCWKAQNLWTHWPIVSYWPIVLEKKQPLLTLKISFQGGKKLIWWIQFWSSGFTFRSDTFVSVGGFCFWVRVFDFWSTEGCRYIYKFSCIKNFFYKKSMIWTVPGRLWTNFIKIHMKKQSGCDTIV